VSQAGETADTLATLRYAHEQKQHVMSIVNGDLDQSSAKATW
jgi:glucosamine--fructose-6-phosphate aminotransferase (isomerizing)